MLLVRKCKYQTIKSLFYLISGNFQGIYISRISLVTQFVNYKYTSQKKEWSPAAICEIKILEMENEDPFVKYTTLENSHLYGKLIRD